MQTPLFVRPLTADERATLATGLRSASAFTVRRCHILLASAEGKSTTTMAHDLRCTDQTVRNSQFLPDGSVDPTKLLPRNAGFGAVNGAQAMRSVQLQLRFGF